MKTVKPNLVSPPLTDEEKQKRRDDSEAHTVQNIPLSSIDFGNNVRKSYTPESITELAETIKRWGLIQPITLRPEGTRYVVNTGHRRFLACKEAKLETVPAIIRMDYDSDSIQVIQMIENIQREDLAPLDLEAGLKDMVAFYDNDETAVAQRLGKSREWVRYNCRAADVRASLSPELQLKTASIPAKTMAALASDPGHLEARAQALLDRIDNPEPQDDAQTEPPDGKGEPKPATPKTPKAPKPPKEEPAFTLTITVAADGTYESKANKEIPEAVMDLIRNAVEEIRKAYL